MNVKGYAHTSQLYARTQRRKVHCGSGALQPRGAAYARLCGRFLRPLAAKAAANEMDLLQHRLELIKSMPDEVSEFSASMGSSSPNYPSTSAIVDVSLGQNFSPSALIDEAIHPIQKKRWLKRGEMSQSERDRRRKLDRDRYQKKVMIQALRRQIVDDLSNVVVKPTENDDRPKRPKPTPRGELPEEERNRRRQRERERYHQRKYLNGPSDTESVGKKAVLRSEMTPEQREDARRRDRERYHRGKSKESMDSGTSRSNTGLGHSEMGDSEITAHLKDESGVYMNFHTQIPYSEFDLIQNCGICVDVPCLPGAMGHEQCLSVGLADVAPYLRHKPFVPPISLNTMRKSVLCAAIARVPIEHEIVVDLCTHILNSPPGAECDVWRSVVAPRAQLPVDPEAVIHPTDIGITVRLFMSRCARFRDRTPLTSMNAVSVRPAFASSFIQSAWRGAFERQRAQLFFEASRIVDTPFVIVGDNYAAQLHAAFANKPFDGLSNGAEMHSVDCSPLFIPVTQPNAALVELSRCIFLSDVQHIVIAFDSLLQTALSLDSIKSTVDELVDLLTINSAASAKVLFLTPPFCQQCAERHVALTDKLVDDPRIFTGNRTFSLLGLFRSGIGRREELITAEGRVSTRGGREVARFLAAIFPQLPQHVHEAVV